MKFTEILFKFPIRMYDPSFTEEAEEKYREETEGGQLIPESVIGYARVRVEDIVSIQDYFSKFMDMEYIKENGPNATFVMTRDSEYFCAWKREKFEQELDKHVAFLENKKKEMMYNAPDSQKITAETLTPEMAKFIEGVIKEYKKQVKQTKQIQD